MNIVILHNIGFNHHTTTKPEAQTQILTNFIVFFFLLLLFIYVVTNPVHVTAYDVFIICAIWK